MSDEAIRFNNKWSFVSIELKDEMKVTFNNNHAIKKPECKVSIGLV